MLIKDVRLYGAGDGTEGDVVTFCPTAKQAVVADKNVSIPVTLSPVTDAAINLDENIPIYDATEPVYVVSSIYAPKEIVKNKINATYATYQDTDYLRMSFSLMYGLHEWINIIKLPISHQYPVLRPQSEYTYEFTIEHEWI